jgi:hypothetical protein
MSPKTPTARPRTALLADLKRRAREGDATARWLLRLLEEGQRAASGPRTAEDAPAARKTDNLPRKTAGK